VKNATGVIAACCLLLAWGTAARTAQVQAQTPVQDGAAAVPARFTASDIGESLFYAMPDQASLASVRAHADQIGVVAPQSFALERNGELRGSLPQALAAVARDSSIELMPLVVNAGFSRYNAMRLLRSASARDRAIGALVDQARDLALVGWQIDFENMPSFERAAFSRFVAEAAAALHRHGKLLSVAVAARTSDNPHSQTYRTFSGVYDYAALGRSADFLSVMAYPENDGTHPGPLASSPWVQRVIQHVLLQVPPEKLSLGLPTYQTDWMQRRIRISVRRRIAGKIRRVFRYIYRLFHRNGPAIDTPEQPVQWDPVLQSAYRITGTGHRRQVTWVEDERSFAAKLHLVTQYHLRGFSVWRIGLEDPHIWSALPQAERAEALPTEPGAPPQLQVGGIGR